MRSKLILGVILLSSFALAIFSYKNFFAEEMHDYSVPRSDLMNELTIIVPSCDKYSELWDPHFKLLFKYWPNLNGKYSSVPVILVSNKLDYKNDRVTSFKTGKDISWSDNIKAALSTVKTKYVIVLMEDFLMNAPINDERLVDILELLEKTKSPYAEIALDENMFTIGAEKAREPSPDLDGVIIRSQDGDYRTSLQACVWNIDMLKRLLVKGESAWDFEIKGTKRSHKILDKFYLVVKDPVFSYINSVEKGIFHQNAIDYIRSQGIEFESTKLPVDK